MGPSATDVAVPASASACPENAPAPTLAPHTRAEHETLAYWLGVERDDLDRELLSASELEAQAQAMRFDSDGERRITDLSSAIDPRLVQSELDARMAFLRERIGNRTYITEGDDARRDLERGMSQRFDRMTPSLRAAREPVDIRCAPLLTPLRSTSGSARFDRNACSRTREGDPVEVLGTFGPDLWLVRTREALGFISQDAPLSPAVDKAQEAELRKGISKTAPLTRRAVLERAFSFLGKRYGWGDQDGGMDCSRFVLEVFRPFGVLLPRASIGQRDSGPYTVEIPKEATDTDRLALLDAADERGVTLIHFPGHIMLYLGRDRDGVPRAMHAFAEYLSPCGSGGETLFEVDRVGVTDLELGRGTSRRSFLERMDALSVWGDSPGQALLAFAKFRRPVPPQNLDPKACEDGLDNAFFRSPRAPNARQPLRVIASTTHDARPAGLFLVDPNGKLVEPPVHDLGVGPYARFVEVANPKPGRWTALLADGPRMVACERFRVATDPAKPEPRAEEAPVWNDRFQWERDTENLYAAFVEQLFSHPLDDLRTWSSLSELISNPERNLLFNHLSMDEDTRLKLTPDCADLPYLLRAYFAFKVSLPFGFRNCSRGRAGAPPRCNALRTNRELSSASDDVSAFASFARTSLGSGVHSASGRTVPSDEDTDLYPVPLNREALKPGTVYADPYGHMIVVAKWVPQGLGGTGMMLGADAQPDATVGRRRFFRGNFLFTPDTDDIGAGFKTFRPIVPAEGERSTLTALSNEQLMQTKQHTPFSMVQYQGSADDFYNRMDELIYPRPVAVEERVKQAVDSFDEQVRRRIESIDILEEYVKSHRATITMPDGYDIFETEGAWEDFATPSRDMRLLIAIDVVKAVPEQVRTHPERFGIAPAARDRAYEDTKRALDELLKSRAFSYTRSDGSAHSLTLFDVMARADLLEMAYNPNDCPELRWGAPKESAELSTCKRRAPEEQTRRMARYRDWFHTRTRPPRP